MPPNYKYTNFNIRKRDEHEFSMFEFKQLQ